VAAARAAHRERIEAGRERDAFESDAGLQQRTEDVYAQLASDSWLAPWTRLSGAVDAGALAARLLG
jgi:dTMP kinase